MFKRISLGALSLALGLSLAACGSDAQETSSSNSESNAEETKPAEQEDVKNEPKKDENGDYVLEEVGQTVTTDAGTVELLKIKTVNETVDISPLKVTINNLKVFKVSEINDEFKELLEINTEEKIGEDFTYLQVQFTAENTEERNIDWLDLETIVLSNGQQIDANFKDFIIDDGDSDYTFYGKVKKDFTTSVIVKDSNFESVKMIFSSVDDSDSYETITEKQQVEYSFE